MHMTHGVGDLSVYANKSEPSRTFISNHSQVAMLSLAFAGLWPETCLLNSSTCSFVCPCSICYLLICAYCTILLWHILFNGSMKSAKQKRDAFYTTHRYLSCQSCSPGSCDLRPFHFKVYPPLPSSPQRSQWWDHNFLPWHMQSLWFLGQAKQSRELPVPSDSVNKHTTNAHSQFSQSKWARAHNANFEQITNECYGNICTDDSI